MCDHISNVPRRFRTDTQLLTGAHASFDALEEEFSDIPSEQRARISVRVLGSLPRAERHQFVGWVETKTNARPVSDGFTQLLTFYAVCAAAKTERSTVDDVVAQIERNRSAAGLLVPKTAC